MNVPLRVLHALRDRAGRRVAVVVGIVLTATVFVGSIAALVAAIEPGALSSIAERGADAPADVLLAAAAFLSAFVLRAALWRRVVPTLPFGHALSGVLVATGANHVLPFRLGEPLRVVSVVRRAGMRADDATASTVALRVGDVMALLVIGLALGPRIVADALGWWGVPIVALLVVVAAVAVRSVMRAVRAGRLRRPDLVVLVGTLAAWMLEGVLVWRIASWAGADVGYLDAVLVGAVAVAAQLVAIAPGGVGTYEAAAVIALTAVGVPATDAVAVAVAVHLAKTVLTIVSGLVASVVPSPSLLGRMRVPTSRLAASAPVGVPAGVGGGGPEAEPGAEAPRPDPSRPVVLFLPAYNEEPRVAGVIERAPATVAGHPVQVVVVDDGSSDDTAMVARAAGADVVTHDPNRGLGAAVATGFRVGVARDAVAVAFCDADGEYDPAELESLVAPIVEGRADYVVGSRFAGTIEHMRPHRRFGNQVLTKWVRWMSRTPVTDGQSGYRALSYEAARDTVSAHDYNYAQVLTLDLVMRGYRYHEVPITYHFRESGRSFVRLGRYLRRCVPAAWRVVNDRVVPPEPATSI
ncbi:MAG: lysylphosphatidylglycerol synthase domain-containing protein [Actinomycetota bacterium]